MQVNVSLLSFKERWYKPININSPDVAVEPVETH